MPKPIQVKCSFTKVHELSAEQKEPLTPVGSSYLHMNTDICSMGVFGLSNQISMPRLREALSSSLLKHERFCSIIEESKDGTLTWVKKTDTNLDDHIVIPCLQSSYAEENDFIEKYVASLASYTSMDLSKPPWEVHVLNYKSSQDNSEATMIFRVHHSMGDCISLMSLLLDSTRLYSHPESKPTISNSKKSRDLGLPKCSIKGIMVWLWRFILFIGYSIYILVDSPTRILHKDKKIMTSSIEIGNSHKIFTHLRIDIQDLRKIGKAIGGTINDVSMGIITAGLVSHLENLKDEGKLLRLKNVADIQMNAVIPVDIRSPSGLYNVNDIMKAKNKMFGWGNKISAWLVPVPMIKRKQWLDYCRASRKHFEIRKVAYSAQSSFSIVLMIYKLFGSKGLGHFSQFISLGKTLMFSNVQGPVEEVTFAGVKITRILTTLSGHPQELIVYLQTYARNAEITFLAGNESFADPQRLCDHCAHALSMMKEEAFCSM